MPRSVFVSSETAMLRNGPPAPRSVLDLIRHLNVAGSPGYPDYADYAEAQEAARRRALWDILKKGSQ